MEFFNEAVRTLEAIVEALNGGRGKDDPPQVSRHRIRRTECPEFTKTMVRVKKHVRPPVRADPEKGRHSNTLKPAQITSRQHIFKNRRKIYGFLYYCRFNDVNLSGGPWRRRWGVGCDQPHGRIRVGQPGQQCSCAVK